MFIIRLIRVPAFAVICLVFLLFQATTTDARCGFRNNTSVELRVLSCLRSAKTETLPPVNFTNGVRTATNIFIEQAYFVVYELNDRENHLSGNVYLQMKWVDKRLTWEPSKYKNVKKVIIPAGSLWTPEPSFVFSEVPTGDKESSNRGINTFRAKVKYDGTVEWPIFLEYGGNCQVDYSTFPVDKQTCDIRLFFQPADMNQDYIIEDHYILHYSMSTEWKVYDSSIHVEPVLFAGSQHKRIRINLKLMRRYKAYMYMLVAPLVIVALLCLLVFWVPIENSQRFVYATTLLMSILLLFLCFQNNMPTGVLKVPYLMKCLLCEMTFLSIFIIISIFTFLAYYHDPRNRLPPIVKKILLNPIVKKLTFVGNDGDKDSSQHPSDVENHFNNSATPTATSSKSVDKALHSLCQFFSTLRERKFQHQSILIGESKWKQVAVVAERLAFYCAVLVFFIAATVVPNKIANHNFDFDFVNY